MEPVDDSVPEEDTSDDLPEETDLESLQSYTVPVLRGLAEAHGVEFEGLRKDNLISALDEALN